MIVLVGLSVLRLIYLRSVESLFTGWADLYHQTDYLLQIYWGLNVATLEELGFDTTVERKAVNGIEQFRIKVTEDPNSDPVYFETVDWISNACSDYVAGRGTRVWKAMKVDIKTNKPCGKICALKDSWVESSRKMEGEWYDIIYKAAKGNPELQRMTEESFLRVLTHGKVLHGGRQQNTSHMRRFSCDHPSHDKYLVIEKADPDEQTCRILSTVHSDIRSLPVRWKHFLCRRFHERVHYRIVLDDVGIPMDRCTNWLDVCRGLIGACKGKHISILDAKQ